MIQMRDEAVVEALLSDQRSVAMLNSMFVFEAVNQNTINALIHKVHAAWHELKILGVLTEEQAKMQPQWRYDRETKKLVLHDMSPDTSHLPDRF